MTRLAIASLLALAACGHKGPLGQLRDKDAPPQDAAARAAETARVNRELTLPTQAAPRRVDDVLSKSVERRSDDFDLPPP